MLIFVNIQSRLIQETDFIIHSSSAEMSVPQNAAKDSTSTEQSIRKSPAIKSDRTLNKIQTGYKNYYWIENRNSIHGT
jgi:hypothetical protein